MDNDNRLNGPRQDCEDVTDILNFRRDIELFRNTLRAGDDIDYAELHELLLCIEDFFHVYPCVEVDEINEEIDALFMFRCLLERLPEIIDSLKGNSLSLREDPARYSERIQDILEECFVRYNCLAKTWENPQQLIGHQIQFRQLLTLEDKLTWLLHALLQLQANIQRDLHILREVAMVASADIPTEHMNTIRFLVSALLHEHE